MYFQELFLSVLNMSITTAYVILAVLLLRLALKGLPKKYGYALWSVVGFRLVCPVSFKSIFSLFSLKPFDMTKAQEINDYSLTYIKPEKPILRDELTTGVSAVNSLIESNVVPSDTFQRNYSIVLLTLEFLWVVGILSLLIISLVKFIKLKKQLRFAVKAEGNIYTCDSISSPFIVGIIKPKIYIPSGIDEDYKEYVLAHERYHLKRFDNVIKLFAYFLLVLHWFNPLVWLAFYLMTKDMEMSCDEAVLSKNEEIKKAYGTALLSFATDKKFPAPSPVSFSENGVKARIKNVLKYKKPKKAVQAIAIILCLALLTACAANPKQTVTEETVKDTYESIAGALESDVYTAGKVIGANMSLSLVRDNGYYYDKITIKKDSLKIVDNLGNEIFNSEKAEETPLETKEEYGVLSVEYEDRVPLMIYEEYGYLFRDGDYTCITYTNSYLSADGDITYKVYFNNGEPFAFCDMEWVYWLEPEDMNKLIGNTVIENEKGNYIKGDYFGEAHRILDIKYYDRTEKEVNVYLYAKVAWLSAAKGNQLGHRLVNTSGGAGFAVITFEKDGNKYTLKTYEGIGTADESELKKCISENDYARFEQMKKTGALDLDQTLYKQAAEKYSFDANEYIATAFDLWDGKDRYSEDYETLLNFGEYTVKYCFSQFINGDNGAVTQTKYSLVLQELLYLESPDIKPSSGKAYFDALVEGYRQIFKDYDYSEENFRNGCPYGYLLLTMTGEIKHTPKVSEDKAETIAFQQLKEDYGKRYHDFVFSGDIKLRQPNEGDFLVTVNPTGNPYYEVLYGDETQAFSVVYYIDSETGDVLGSKELSN